MLLKFKVKNSMKIKLLFLVIFITGVMSASAEPVHVLVWDERQPRQSEAYDNFLGNEIVSRLKASADDLELRSVSLDDPEQGLSAENLEWADVVVWWGHARQWEISSETVKRKIMKPFKAGKLDFIFLHSAHFATPFMELMNERTIVEARQKFPDPEKGKPVEFEFIYPPQRNAPARESLVTPAYLAMKRGKGIGKVRVDMPNCCFPAYRPDGKPSEIRTLLPKHPIAKGIPKTFTVAHTEMYDEPFHVPTPDAVVFEERWDGGERFRNAMLWKLGKGWVCYFRPGHETYPIYKQPIPLRIVENTVRWFGTKPDKLSD